jgi:hypothetical protein
MLGSVQSAIENRKSSMDYLRRHSMCNVYLVLAYGLVWGIFTFYAWVIHHRQQTLEKEVKDLKRSLAQQ